ncbi:hypothetical protein SKAU_G00010090 [Synaphobranchus kaupii]|uniref:Uncharacterized protein n=1 Tax=Synaphobranchus kaupii TaxID=118154 RepID=A0A9Q1JB45_SYNKA|nr:hypothetical protein SKAU_G00010090 [Synaphobranchus kaupii]
MVANQTPGPGTRTSLAVAYFITCISSSCRRFAPTTCCHDNSLGRGWGLVGSGREKRRVRISKEVAGVAMAMQGQSLQPIAELVAWRGKTSKGGERRATPDRRQAVTRSRRTLAASGGY